MKDAKNTLVEYEFTITTGGAATVRHVITVPFPSGYIIEQRYSRTSGSAGDAVIRAFNNVNATEGAMDDTIDQKLYHDASDTDGIFANGADFASTTTQVPICFHDATDATVTVTYDSTDYESIVRGQSVDVASETWQMTFELTTTAAEVYDFAITLVEDLA